MIPNELKLEILEKITTLDDLLNLCKSSKTFYNLCKENPIKTKIINMKKSNIKDILIRNWEYNIDSLSQNEINSGKTILNENPSTDDDVDEIVNRYIPFMKNSRVINDIKKYYIHLNKIKMEQLTANVFTKRNFEGRNRYKRYELEKIANDLKIKFDNNDTNYDIYMNIRMKLEPINLYKYLIYIDPRDWDTYESQSILKYIAKQFNVKYDENTNLYKTLLLFFAAGNKKWIGRFYKKNFYGHYRFRRFELVEMANYFGISTNDDMTNSQIFTKISDFFTRTTKDV